MSGIRFVHHRLGVFLAGAVVLGAWPGTAGAQAPQPVEVLWNAYVSSVLYPEKFDSYVAGHRQDFTAEVRQHLDRVIQRLWDEHQKDIEFCGMHTDPARKQACLQERPAAGMCLWGASVRAVLNGESGWPDTVSGSLYINAKKTYEEMGGDWVATMTPFLPPAEPMVRALLTP